MEAEDGERNVSSLNLTRFNIVLITHYYESIRAMQGDLGLKFENNQ